jgi:hypothetical protein
MFWIPLFVFIAHIIEEYPRFPAWATRHFGATSNVWYVYSHVVLVVVVAWIGQAASVAPPQTTAPMLANALACTLAMNAVFHVVTTILFREYSPGIITGVLVVFPGAAYVIWRSSTDALVTSSQFFVSVVLGVIVQVVVIASLYLPMNIDWRCRQNR